MTDAIKNTWQNRIVGMGAKPAKDFVFNPLNWRTHPEFQRNALNAVLSEVGWVTGVIENITTGNLLDGHARIEEALAKDPSTLVPFIQVELTEEEERKVLAVLDPIGALAGSDDEKLRQLAEIVNFESDSLNQLMELKEEDEINFDDFFKNNPNEQILNNFVIELEFGTEDEYKLISEKLAALADTPALAVKKLLDL